MSDRQPRRSARLAPKPVVEETPQPSTSSSTKSPVKRPAKKSVSTEVKPVGKPPIPQNIQLEMLKKVLYILNTNDLISKGTPENCKTLMKGLLTIYAGGFSYTLNEYMRTNKVPPELNVENDADFAIFNADFVKFISSVIDYIMETIEIKEYIDDLSEQYGSRERPLTSRSFLLTTNGLIDGTQIYDFLNNKLSPEQKLKLYVKFYTELFKRDDLTKVSQSGMVVYRGLVEFNDSFLKEKTKSFTSTSTCIDAAIEHVTSPLIMARKQQPKDGVILEMHIAPGIRYVGYNAINNSDLINCWQNELIFAPGLKFTEIGNRTKNETYTKIIVNVTSDNSSEAGTSGTSFGRSKKKRITLKYILKSIKYIHGL